MKYVDFQRRMRPFGIFSLQDIRKYDLMFDSRRLVEWQKKGHILKVINGWYAFSDAPNEESFRLLVSNRIYAPSYLSLEYVLAKHSVIPEGVFEFTAISTRKTTQFQTSLGHYSYRQLKPELNFGYTLIKSQWGAYRMADLEKALLDYLYLHPNVSSIEDFVALRWNTPILREMDVQKLRDYLSLFDQRRLSQKIELLLKYLEQ